MDQQGSHAQAAAGRQRRRTVATAAVALAIAGGALVALALTVAWPSVEVATERQARAQLGASELVVTIADTDARRSWGLQGRRDLAAGTGMVFVYPDAVPVTFATKTVTFPIDVVFVGPDRRVVGVGRLDGSQTLASSPSPVAWVVEVPAGWAEAASVTVGSRFVPPR